MASQIVAQPVRFQHPSADESPDQDHQQNGRQYVQVSAVHKDTGLGEQPCGETAIRRGREDEDAVAEHEGQEAPEDGCVANPGVVAVFHPLQDFLLAQRDEQGTPHPLYRTVESGSLFALEDQTDNSVVKSVIESR